MIKRFFHPDEVEAILSMPIHVRAIEDTRIWHWDKWGEFSVRLAYQVGVKMDAVDRTSSSSNA